MKKTRKMVRLLATAASLVMAAVLVVGAAAAPDWFKGTWYSVDLADGSNQTLRIGGGPGNSYHVRYYDDGASVCGWHPVTGGDAASAQGSLTATDNVLSGNMDVYCLASPRYLYANGDFRYTYDSVEDTLTDQHGNTWTH
jgi:hypothetical protein